MGADGGRFNNPQRLLTSAPAVANPPSEALHFGYSALSSTFLC